MKRVVNGVEMDLPKSDADVYAAEDRLMVRNASGAHSALAVISGDTVLVSYLGHQFRIEAKSARSASGKAAHSGEIHAPMPGLITDVTVQVGESVKSGIKLAVLEAMKTQQAFHAPFDGTVSKVYVQPKEQVAEGQLLLVITPVIEGAVPSV